MLVALGTGTALDYLGGSQTWVEELAVPLNIKKKQTHEAARRLAELTGESLTEAVDKAILERLERIEARTALDKEELWQRIKQIQDELAKAPTYDRRTVQEILEDMYDEDGLPR